MFCPKCGKAIPDDASFCLKCGNALAGGGVKTAPSAQKGRGAVIAVALVSLLFVFLIVAWSSKNKQLLTSQPPPPVLVVMNSKLFTGQNTIKGLGYLQNTFTVEPGMQNFHVIGHFTASGGLTNDIQAVVADQDEFQNWINGHQAKTYYSTPRVTTGKIDIGPLAPGKYVIAFSNKSGLVERQLSAEVEADWTIQR
jgi:zinc ribbon protein